jgi:signal recognition particle receptor subunit beta
VLLANANDRDSLRSTQADLEFVRSLDKATYVVATYMSMAGEEMTAKQVTKALGLEAEIPVLPCHLRDRDSVTGVVKSALELAEARSAG